MNESQLVRAIKAHIEKGDKAKDKAEQHYIAAGQYLKQLKDDCPDQKTFLEKVEKEIGIGKSRTYELLQIGDGRKTVAEVRADTAQRTADTKDRLKLSATNGQNADDGERAEALPTRVMANDDGHSRRASPEEEEATFAVLNSIWRGDDDPGVESPDKILANFLDTVDRHAAVLRAYKKIFKVAALSQEQKSEAWGAINKLLTKWQRVQWVLEAGSKTCDGPPPDDAAVMLAENAPPPDVSANNMKAKFAADDGLDIPEYLRRAPKAAAR
jgi:hypothetical protein